MRAVLSGVIAGVLTGTTVAGSLAHAQPAPAPPPAPAPDLARAREVYGAAERALSERRFADAIRQYTEVYDITRDPALLYKLGTAHEQAGACDVALRFYQRYLDEGTPTEEHAALTRARISACGAATRAPAEGAAPPANGADAAGAPAAPGTPGTPGTADLPASGMAAAGSAMDPPAAPADAAPLAATNQGPWLLVGGAVALLTIGAVLAYSANAAESDVNDLYVGLAGTPPVFDARTQERYDDLIAEGERYEKLSWISLGAAGAIGIGAAVWFYRNRGAAAAERRTVHVAPTAHRDGAGIAARFRF